MAKWYIVLNCIVVFLCVLIPLYMTDNWADAFEVILDLVMMI
jgi:hypothetical protein